MTEQQQRYQVYPHPNRALVKALYQSLREGLISRAEFVACLLIVMGKHR
jgi:hypothetical protein